MPAVEQKPDFSDKKILQWIWENYSIGGQLEPLPGERDLNFKLSTDDGESLVCKISGDPEKFELLAAQNQVMSLLDQRGVAAIPKIRTSNKGESLVPLENCVGRILSFVPGTVLAECAPYRPALLRDLGRTVGLLNEALAGFDHSAFHYEFDWDLANAISVVERYGNLITDAGVRAGVEQINEEFKTIVAPQFGRLRSSVIHNDANDYNVLVEGDRVTGLIDFGDMVYSYTICDLAIAMAYASLGVEDVLQVVGELAAGHHQVMPIGEVELAVLFPMMRMRLAVSACMAAQQMRLRPDDPYLSISQEPIRRALPRILACDVDEVRRLLEDSLT